MIRKFLFAALFLPTATAAFSQSPEDTTFLTAAIDNAVNLYQKALAVQSRLYNGSKYVAPEHTLEQHPYFPSEDWLTGTVFYDGEFFTDVPLMYDLNKDALIAEHHSSGNPLELVWDKLQHFTLGGHHFEKIENDSVGNSLPKTGFYDILYNGETRLVAHRQKFLKKEIVSQEIIIKYDERNRYFLFRDGTFFPVKTKSSVLKLLADKKPELRRFLKQHRDAFLRERELMLKSVAEHYDTLK